MNRLRLRLLRLGLAGLVWLGMGVASAQATLEAYTRAKTALEASIAATPGDAVASLDALRRAKRAFTPLGEALGGPLNQGLQTTFERAEQAIINASPADLKVQGAVLFGGFQRSLYEAALTEAQDGNTAQAVRLLTVLGQDLELTPAQFSGSGEGQDAARALQFTFENRLAARSLQQLEALRALPENARDARYEVLAALYSHVFLIQDSPRLPAATQVTVLDAIQALIARRPIAPSLTTLQTQLQDFQSASAAAQQRLEVPAAEGQPAPRTEATVPDQTEAPAAAQATENPEQAGAGATTPERETTSEVPVPDVEASDQSSAPVASAPQNDGAGDEQAATTPRPTAPATPAPTTPPATAVPDEATPSGTSAASSATISSSDSFFGLLSEPVRTYLLIAAGLLALVGVVLLLAQAGAALALNLATILLLLPVLAEGLIALGAVLAPLVGMPALARGEAYSLFLNPLVQSVWVLLALVAGFVLLFTRRSAAAKPRDARPAAEPTSSPPPLGAPLGSAGRINWDEDF